MNILIICNYGKNRSGYLASYLQQKGYATKFGGVYPESDNMVMQDLVDWSQVIIFVQPQTKEIFLKSFQIKKQKLLRWMLKIEFKYLSRRKKIGQMKNGKNFSKKSLSGVGKTD